MKESLVLYSVFHKPFFIPKAKYVSPIHGGKALSGSDLNILTDNTGDNISSLNNTFCELTVLYWMWKNAPRNTEFVGLSHYRRYFIKKPFLNALKPARTISLVPTQENIDKYIDEELYNLLIEALKTKDVVIQQPMYIHRNKKGTFDLEQHYKMEHISTDWDVVMQTIKEMYPAYEKSLDGFNHSLKMSFFNMMIAPWNVWEGYMKWLFDILFEVKKRIVISESVYQARVFGFMSERLINLYVKHNDLQPAYFPVGVFDK
jgi:hypothetical protein